MARMIGQADDGVNRVGGCDFGMDVQDGQDFGLLRLLWSGGGLWVDGVRRYVFGAVSEHGPTLFLRADKFVLGLRVPQLAGCKEPE